MPALPPRTRVEVVEEPSLDVLAVPARDALTWPSTEMIAARSMRPPDGAGASRTLSHTGEALTPLGVLWFVYKTVGLYTDRLANGETCSNWAWKAAGRSWPAQGTARRGRDGARRRGSAGRRRGGSPASTSTPGAEAVAAEIRAAGGSRSRGCRRQDRAGVGAAVAQVVDAFGGVHDVLVDIIGEVRWGSVLEFTDEDWEWSIGTNLRQAFLLCRPRASRWWRRAPAVRWFVASVGAMFAATNHLAYGAKAGLVSLVKTFAQELGPERIRVNGAAGRSRHRGRASPSHLRRADAAVAPPQGRHREGAGVLRVRSLHRGHGPGAPGGRRRQHQDPVGHVRHHAHTASLT
jgi:NAD(P)-dependent dehydrogenase (short-subunit alcohol dehydrogenase family)